MVAITGKRQFGLYTNSQAQYGNDSYFTGYNYTTADSLSGVNQRENNNGF